MSKSVQLEIKLVRSALHQTPKIQESIRVLGLRKIGHAVVKTDSPAVRGLIRKAIHLLNVKRK
jgi:large subunit ribosomal protein L30